MSEVPEETEPRTSPVSLVAASPAPIPNVVENSRYGATAIYCDGTTTLSFAHERRTPIQLAAAKAGQLHALLMLANSGSGLPAHMTLDDQARDNIVALAERLANEVAMLTDMGT
ncbi:hypothetical protein LMG31506_03043 [Cupriavidus yeoncheonensis]|uniref:Uncharacterized protein n=1 Tax=Cupriavidus yeoncheonensis TaxID=1462994 RepID=A0A916MVN5_9BURK|nr:hypothetical protein [Cupriavidus yeoncheonensis]CAG2144601.1 hypothetical protein LMG31506_03043 [Cupriavidus yeoncheonensis]